MVLPGATFVGFEEAPQTIEFPPTFKVRRSASLHYTSQRIPAYTDRIMWRSLLPSLRTRCLEQWIAEKVDTSDHKPVPLPHSLSLHLSHANTLTATLGLSAIPELSACGFTSRSPPRHRRLLTPCATHRWLRCCRWICARGGLDGGRVWRVRLTRATSGTTPRNPSSLVDPDALFRPRKFSRLTIPTQAFHGETPRPRPTFSGFPLWGKIQV